MPTPSSTNPQVSVVIPVYNGTNFLGEAIESVLAQTFADYELLVVDDGSTDGTWNIIESYGARVRGLRKTNGGVASALNLGIREMRSQWFAWLSHDDLWLPNKLEQQVRFLQQHPEFKACYTDYYVIDARGNILREVETPWYPRAQALRALFGYMYIGGSTMLVDRICFDQVGMFSERLRYTQDVDMWLRILRNYEIGRVPVKLGKERTHPAQDSHKLDLFEKEKESFFFQMFRDLGVEGIFPDLASRADEPRIQAKLHTWFADTMARYRGYLDLAGDEYARAIALDPSWRNPARLKSLLHRTRRMLLPAYQRIRGLPGEREF